jgi:hypothetical protein
MVTIKEIYPELFNGWCKNICDYLGLLADTVPKKAM